MKKIIILFFIALLFFSKTVLSYPLKPTDKNFLKPYCQGSADFENFTLTKTPQKIDIEVINVRKWYKNLFRAIKSLGSRSEVFMRSSRIDRKTKKFHSAKLTAYFENNIKCIFKARIRIHGSAGDHISNENFVTSMRVNLIDGNILHRSQFILLLPETRNGDNEVFMTTLLKELNFLAPLTFPITVKVNDNEPAIFLFQEKIAGTLLSTNSRRNGIILAANKNSQIIDSMEVQPGPRKYSLNLGRLIWGENLGTKEIIKALDKLNYVYLQTLGYGNGTKFIGQKIIKRDANLLHIKKDYFLEDVLGFENFSAFDSIMIAAGGVHGLSSEDRRYYYDAVYDRIEPIYYDGEVRILNNDFNLIIHGAYDHYKLGAKKAKKYIDGLNILKFQKNLKLRGFDINIEKINSILDRIKNNLDIIINAEPIEFSSSYVKSYYSEHKNSKDINFKLAFNGKSNIFQLCNIFLDDCVEKKFSSFETLDIFKEQVAKIDDEKILYVRKSLENYIKNIPPKNYGISRMTKIKLDSNSKIYINSSITVDVDNDSKIVKFNMIDDSGRAVIKGEINNWSFSLKGVSHNFIEKNTRPHGVDPQGCITFVDSKVKEISIYTRDTTCPNSIHFIRTNGSINKIKMRNARWDAFDADFSNLEIKNIEVRNTGHHCIGLKGGEYKIITANVKNCEDKGVSSSEFSRVTIEKINIMDSHVGLAAKDSGIIIAKEANIKNTDLCLLSYRNKIEYQGSYISTSKNNYSCENENYFIQNGSKWENFN